MLHLCIRVYLDRYVSVSDHCAKQNCNNLVIWRKETRLREIIENQTIRYNTIRSSIERLHDQMRSQRRQLVPIFNVRTSFQVREFFPILHAQLQTPSIYTKAHFIKSPRESLKRSSKTFFEQIFFFFSTSICNRW